MLKLHISLLFAILIMISCGKKTKSNSKDGEQKREVSSAIIELKSSDDLSQLICQNWIVEDARPPMPKDIAPFGEQNQGTPSLSILNDNNIVENPLTSNMRFGKYEFNDHVLNVRFDDGGKSVYTMKKSRSLANDFTSIGKWQRIDIDLEGRWDKSCKGY